LNAKRHARQNRDPRSGTRPLKAELGRTAATTDGPDADEPTPHPPVAEEPSRRDLLRYGAIALGTTAATALAARPAIAADGAPIILGNSHTSSSETSVQCSGSGQTAFGATSSSTTLGRGVDGFTFAPNGLGVFGVHFNVSGTGAGVLGRSISPTGVGVRGHAENGGTAVRGELTNTSANGIGVFGLNNSLFAGPVPGGGGFGVYGFSAKGHGLVGATGTAGGAAVVGATNSVAGAWAGVFYGPVVVSGDLIVVGGAKSAAVPFSDGTRRQLYCVESPESWFEDFGTGQLVGGRADVPMDPGFAAVAEMDIYHVFLTGYDHDHLLHVTNRTPKGFRVQANAALAALQGRKDCDLSSTFSWRVVAKRKDIAGERLAKVTMPPDPVLPPIEDWALTQRSLDRRDAPTL
jgi:hypothetical protein